MTVCKDMGAANMVGPIAEVLHQRGHTIFPILEGLAGKRWPEVCRIPPVFQGTEDYTILPFVVGAAELFEYYKPNVVVVGTSSPNHLEGHFARIAQHMGIPVVVVEDFWGGSIRVDLREDPAWVITIDQYAAVLARTESPSASITDAGNPGVGGQPIAPAYEVAELRRHGNEQIITLCGGGPETTEQIHLLLECLEVTTGDWKLILLWHPKVADLPDPENGNQPYRETWDALLVSLGDRVIHLNEPRTDNVVVASDLVLAGYSTLLTTAAYAGVATASLVTPGVLKALKEESGLDQIPHVALGITCPIATPIDLAQVPPCSEEARSRLKPFEPLLGAVAIESVLEDA